MKQKTTFTIYADGKKYISIFTTFESISAKAIRVLYRTNANSIQIYNAENKKICEITK